jgi:hypothetical protein
MPGNDLTATRDKIPVSGVTATSTAQANVSQVLTDIIDDLEPKVTPSQMEMSSNLSFLYDGSYYATTNLGYVNFQDRSASPAVNESLYVQNDELYFRDGSGNDFAMTSGGGLSGVGLGGITGGGYGAPIELNWNGTQYRFKDGAGAYDFAPVVMSHSHLRDSAGNDLVQTVPTLGAGYTLTWPSAVSGGASRALQSDASGGLSWSNSFSEDITLTGTAELKHANYEVMVAAAAGESNGAFNATTKEWALGATDHATIDIPFQVGARIRSITFYFTGGDTGTKNFKLLSKTASGGGLGTIASTTSTANTATTVTISSIDHTMTSGTFYVAEMTASATTVQDLLAGIKITYDRP